MQLADSRRNAPGWTISPAATKGLALLGATFTLCCTGETDPDSRVASDKRAILQDSSDSISQLKATEDIEGLLFTLMHCPNPYDIAEAKDAERAKLLDDATKVMRELSQYDDPTLRTLFDRVTVVGMTEESYEELTRLCLKLGISDEKKIGTQTALNELRAAILLRYVFDVAEQERGTNIGFHHPMVQNTLNNGKFNPMGSFAVDSTGTLRLTSTRLSYPGTGIAYMPVREFDLFKKKYRRRRF